MSQKKKMHVLSFAELQEQQSVRTTFKISQKAEENLSFITKRFSIKPKEFFSKIFEEDVEERKEIMNQILKNEKFLEFLVNKYQLKEKYYPFGMSITDKDLKENLASDFKGGFLIYNLKDAGIQINEKLDKGFEIDENGVRKTFVISKKTLRILNEISDNIKISRDLIIENTITFYHTRFTKDTEEKNEALKVVALKIGELHSEIQSYSLKLSKNEYTFSISRRVSEIGDFLFNLFRAIYEEINGNDIVDPDNLEQGGYEHRDEAELPYDDEL